MDDKTAQSGTGTRTGDGSSAKFWFSSPQANLWKQLTNELLYHCIPNWGSYFYDEIDKHPGWSCYLPNTLISIEGVGDTDLEPFRITDQDGVYFIFDGGIPDDGSTFMLSQQTSSPIPKAAHCEPFTVRCCDCIIRHGLPPFHPVSGTLFTLESHRFWDTPNILLHSFNTASKIADFHSTERMLRRGGHELNPLLRNRPARIGIILSFGTGGHILIAWILHRTGHHKLERWFMVPSIGASAGAAGWNYRRF